MSTCCVYMVARGDKSTGKWSHERLCISQPIVLVFQPITVVFGLCCAPLLQNHTIDLRCWQLAEEHCSDAFSSWRDWQFPQWLQETQTVSTHRNPNRPDYNATTGPCSVVKLLVTNVTCSQLEKLTLLLLPCYHFLSHILGSSEKDSWKCWQ